MSASIHVGLPSRDYYQLPRGEPLPLPPPSDSPSFRAPFAISASVYHAALAPAVPITIAALYFSAVTVVNALNRRRGYTPWAVSKTRPFFAFVVVHNVALALYSACTFLAMFRALTRTWPAVRGAGDAVAFVDALCKMHGPRGLGDAVAYSTSRATWAAPNTQIRMLEGSGLPDPTDVGRLWNEGLAFWGWIFYLSKFYEVVDTAIILAKGKRSSSLQTYHHAGAMISMWAGIRYMSPPIWMFVFVNSGIHALMYTYYTLSAFRIRVPQPVKRALTTMQILQFVVGASFAGAHLFLSYSVPVWTPHTVTRIISTAASSASSVATSATSAVSDAASAVSDTAASVATAGIGDMLKRFAYRAVGEEGLAENVPVHRAEPALPGASAVSAMVDSIADALPVPQHVSETRWRHDLVRTRCIDTPGQAFAINLNIFYLLPLTWLFGRFFYRSYLKRSTASPGPRRQSHLLAKSARDAAHGIDRELDRLVRSAEDEVASMPARARSAASGDNRESVANAAKRGGGAVVDAAKKGGEAVKAGAGRLARGTREAGVNGAARARRFVGDKVVGGEMREDGEGVEDGEDVEDEEEVAAEKEDEKEDDETDVKPTQLEENEETDEHEKGEMGEMGEMGESGVKVEKEDKDEESEEGEEGQEGEKDEESEDGEANGKPTKAENEEEADDAPQGLSTSDPKTTGMSYADRMR